MPSSNRAIDPNTTSAVAGQLGGALREFGFDEQHLRARLGAPTSRLTPSVVAVAERRLGADALAAAVAFWHLGLGLDAEDARTVLAPLDVEDLTAAGLLTIHGTTISAALRISPLGGLLVAHDVDRGEKLAADHVLGVGAATRTLAALTPRRRVATTLDLGTGNGAQALLAAAHSDGVVATDINERAVTIARLNASLNGVRNLDVRVGDAFGPVLDDRFDLIVANPPFVISPDTDLAFRDSAMGGEGTSRAVAQCAAERLRPGGTACVLANWMVRRGESEVSTPQAWLADLDCDGFILHHDTLEPVAYAERWMLVPASEDPGRFGETLDRWLAHYAQAGAVGIASGAIILRRTGHPARIRSLRMPLRPTDGGEHVERLLAAVGRFAGPDDPALAGARFALVEPHQLGQRLDYEGGRYEARAATLRLARSAGIEASVPSDLLEALFTIDGQRALGDILDDLADVRGTPRPALRARALPVVLGLFERGFLEIQD